MKDVFVYLSGPMAPQPGFTVEDNIASATEIFHKCVKLGVPCFCPHVIPSGDIDYETWMQFDLAIVKHCTHMLMLPRWQNSQGALRERVLALHIGIPIFENFEEMEEYFGETNRTDAGRTKQRIKKETSVGKKRSDERPQHSDSEGAHQTKEGNFTGVFLDQS